MNKMQMLESNGGELVIIDYDKNAIIRPVFSVDAIGYPTNGFIQVKEDEEYGYLNYGGQLVIEPYFFEAYPFSENGLAFVKEENGIGGYIDRSGEYVIDVFITRVQRSALT